MELSDMGVLTWAARQLRVICRCGCGSGAVTRKHVLCRWAHGCLTTPGVQDAGSLASQLMRASHDEDEQKQQWFRPRQGDGFP